MTHRTRRLIASAAGLATAATTALVGLAPVAFADEVTATTVDELQAAVGGPCVEGRVVTVTAGFSSSGSDLATSCTVTIDLDSNAVALRSMRVAGGTVLTVTDDGEAGEPGSLVVSAFTGDPGIDVAGAALTVAGRARVTATGGTGGAGINNSGGQTTVEDDATITATGGTGAAGIGLDFGSTGSAGTTIASDSATITASGGTGGAGIGGGDVGNGGATTVSDNATVTVSGGRGGGAGIGGGIQGGGGVTVIDGDGGAARVDVSSAGGSAVGAGAQSNDFGSVSVDDGVLNIGSNDMLVDRGDGAGPEVTIGEGGVIESREPAAGGPPGLTVPADGALQSSDAADPGRVLNSGAITVPTQNVAPELAITDHDYLVTFDVNTDDPTASSDPSPVEVFASSFDDGERAFPTDPTRDGFSFRGWTSEPGGGGGAVTSSSELPGASDGTEPEAVTAHAQWRRNSTTDDPQVVTSYGELAEAVAGPCSEVFVRVDASFSNPDDAIDTTCDTTIDLNGKEVEVRHVSIAADTTLTVTDLRAAGDRGTLTAETEQEEPGVRTTDATLVVDGRADLVATGGQNGAGIGGGNVDDGGTVTATGQATITATGGQLGAGVGGGAGGRMVATTASEEARITATGGGGGAGIGTGFLGGSRGAGTTVASGTARITATGGRAAAGIGGGYVSAGGTTTASGAAQVTATGGAGGAGIGGGEIGTGGTTTVLETARITAAGGRFQDGTGGAGIGGGVSASGGSTLVSSDAVVTATGVGGGAGVGGGGAGGDGGVTRIDGTTATLHAMALDGGSAVGAGSTAPGGEPSGFGRLEVTSGVLNVPSGVLRVDPDPTNLDDREVAIGAGGVVVTRELDAAGDPDRPGSGELTTSSAASPGRVENGGSITVPTIAIDDALEIFDHHYEVMFDGNGGDLMLAENPVFVFAASFEAGERDFPSDPTRPGFTFSGWNTSQDGTGEVITASDPLPRDSLDGESVEITAYAQWTRNPSPPPVDPQPPVEEPLPTVTASVDGTPKVGERLTASAALDSSEDEVSYEFQWLRDGEPIAGAASRTYRPGRADIAREVSVEVTASAPGRTPSSDVSRSVPVRPVVGIVGATRVGQELSPRVFVPEGARARYRWETSKQPRRDQERVWDQVGTGSSYTLTPADRGTRVRLVVTLSGEEYSTVRSVSIGRYVKRAAGR